MQQIQKMQQQPKLVIVDQPQQRGMRFRYACEGRAAGSIPAEESTPEHKKWPSCQLLHFTAARAVRIMMRVSLVTKDEPYRPHPHSLVGRDCRNGICEIELEPGPEPRGVFPNLGIQCVRRKEVKPALIERVLNLRINPFQTSFVVDDIPDFDLNVVRLCFEVYIQDMSDPAYIRWVPPVVSEPIYDKKATCSAILKICRLDRHDGSCRGMEEVFLLCDKVQKEDIEVVFFDGDKWEALGDFSPTDVHRQVAIVFRTPPYRDVHITRDKEVQIKLRRPSDQQVSEALNFRYLPEKLGDLAWNPSIASSRLNPLSPAHQQSVKNQIHIAVENSRKRARYPEPQRVSGSAERPSYCPLQQQQHQQFTPTPFTPSSFTPTSFTPTCSQSTFLRPSHRPDSIPTLPPNTPQNLFKPFSIKTEPQATMQPYFASPQQQQQRRPNFQPTTSSIHPFSGLPYQPQNSGIYQQRFPMEPVQTPVFPPVEDVSDAAGNTSSLPELEEEFLRKVLNNPTDNIAADQTDEMTLSFEQSLSLDEGAGIATSNALTNSDQYRSPFTFPANPPPASSSELRFPPQHHLGGWSNSSAAGTTTSLFQDMTSQRLHTPLPDGSGSLSRNGNNNNQQQQQIIRNIDDELHLGGGVVEDDSNVLYGFNQYQ